MPPLSVMIKPVSGACDMDCHYCFYRDEVAHRQGQALGRMTYETLEHIV